jgi:hypothetical protein
VCKVLPDSLVPVVWIEAVNVLPGVARLAVDCVSVIVREVAYTLDRIRLFFRLLNGRGNGRVIFDNRVPRRSKNGLTGKWCLRRRRRGRVCHNLRDLTKGVDGEGREREVKIKVAVLRA